MQIQQYVFVVVISLVAVVLILELMHIIAVKNKLVEIKDESDYWKWGVFYYNPYDPRIMVPKRMPLMGWTFNFAQPGTIISIVGFSLFIILLRVLEN
jgi:uncharacterized membrane protein